jgi:hypothetical protein
MNQRGGRIDIEKTMGRVEEASEESFPASDPPSNTPITSGGPPPQRGLIRGEGVFHAGRGHPALSIPPPRNAARRSPARPAACGMVFEMPAPWPESDFEGATWERLSFAVPTRMGVLRRRSASRGSCGAGMRVASTRDEGGRR